MGQTTEAYRDALRRNVAAGQGRQASRSGSGVEDFFGQAPGREPRHLRLAAVACGADRIAAGRHPGPGHELGGRPPRSGVSAAALRPDIEVHFHNDLGHAVSNAFAALEAGANYVSTSLLGIGERTGITPTSSLLVNLYVLDAASPGRYDLAPPDRGRELRRPHLRHRDAAPPHDQPGQRLRPQGGHPPRRPDEVRPAEIRAACPRPSSGNQPHAHHRTRCISGKTRRRGRRDVRGEVRGGPDDPRQGRRRRGT